MSQRDALLAGAKKCLVQKGYSRTTARDIVAASGAHLASIGYHFGSKDRLMNLAAIELTSEWGDSIEAAVRSVGGDSAGVRLAALVAELVRALPESRDLLLAGVAATAQAPFDDALRGDLAATYSETRKDLAAVVLGTGDQNGEAEAEQGLGTLVYALVIGLAVQAVTDPDSLPTPDVAAEGVRALLHRDE